jgi:hypothetical protein
MEENLQPPVVAPRANVRGPFWSVMIPTYNPAPHYEDGRRLRLVSHVPAQEPGILRTRGDSRAALQQLRQARNFESRTGFWRLSLRRLRAGFARWRVDRTR